MLQELVAAGHEIIRSTWTEASVLVKYYLVGTLAYLAYRKDLSTEGLGENLLDNSKIVVFTLMFAGMLLAAFQIEVKAFLPVFSQLIALVYLGYLFWVY